MIRFRGLRELVRAGILSVTRSRAALFWTIMFPLFLLGIFGAIFSRFSTMTEILPDYGRSRSFPRRSSVTR
ncbi:MAG: hypothetical protein R3E12_02485 [Candidatus Eisenbacteria bacterium]